MKYLKICLLRKGKFKEGISQYSYPAISFPCPEKASVDLFSDKNRERWSVIWRLAWHLFKFYLHLRYGSYSLFSLEKDTFSVICDDCRKSFKSVFWSTNTVSLRSRRRKGWGIRRKKEGSWGERVGDACYACCKNPLLFIARSQIPDWLSRDE